VSQNFAEALNLQRVRGAVRVDKPAKEIFFRVHPGQEGVGFLHTYCLHLKDGPDRGFYLVEPALWPHLATEPGFKLYRLCLCVTRQGEPFLWPAKLPGADGRLDEWSLSALEAVEEAKSVWIRLLANLNAGCYDRLQAGSEPAPSWPAEDLQQLLRLGFKHRVIRARDDAVLRNLRPES
jgi:hypothetical protein